MRVFVTGASGYIGGTVAARLMAGGHRVTGLARSTARAEQLRTVGIEPVIGSLDDSRVLADVARRTDAVINAADSDHRPAAEALIEALAGSGKPLLHTSGISIVGDKAAGEPDDRIFTEETPLVPAPEKAPRVAIDRLVRDAATRKIRSVVLCNPLVYGRGLGLHPDSVQIPALAEQALVSGVARYIGRGLNIWSHAHVEDVADLYLLALEQAPAGSFYFVENGEASFRDMADALASALRLGPSQSWTIDEAIAAWGYQRAVFSLGSNCRVRADRARRKLGWRPRHSSVVDWIRQDLAVPH
ncbi:MAG: NAD-dependent epimerase/dehydratase family protein [Alphaproteobacteria bacterium]|nr:NAD-dependent epimerase/dehydratase family protein [Alphaproteobacteria bacterium]